MRSRPSRACTLALWLLAACGQATGDSARAIELSSEQLHDPESCKPCHAQHYREWQSSMHAYSAKDPVFIAMNERGQIETGGELGDFCVRCHAPLAVELGLTSDGLNLPDLEHPSARGVTCYFCHNTISVEQDHNQHLQLGHDDVMRGGLGNSQHADARNTSPPLPTRAHRSAYSPLHDANRADSATLCGSCHDVVNHNGAAVERTFAEWRESRHAGGGSELRTCSHCHMQSYLGRATLDGPERQLHRHLWPGVDIAFEKEFPGIEAQKAAIDCAFEGAIGLTLSASASGPARQSFDVQLSNLGVGHDWPSGAAQDRRAWVEFVGYDASGKINYKSGVFAEGEVVVGSDTDPVQIFREHLFDADARPTHMFWRAAPSAEHPLGYEANLLPVDGMRTLHYDLPQPAARITARLRMRPLGLEVLDDFQGLTLPITERVIDSGYLDDGPIRGRVRTFTVRGTARELVLVEGAAPPAVTAQDTPATPESSCRDEAYVSLLPHD